MDNECAADILSSLSIVTKTVWSHLSGFYWILWNERL